MKKTVKKLAAVGLTLTSVMSLVACGNSNTSDSGSTSNKEVTKPTSFKVMIDGTVLTESNGGADFRKQLEKATDLEGCIEWVQPDHSGYYEQVSIAFNSETSMPDLVILSSDYYAQYAANDFLWDMTDAWNASETKNSGRLIDTAQKVYDSLMVNGPDGNKAMYGFTPARGNGCVTYVKSSWAEEAGYNPSDLETKQLSWTEYYDMLKKMQAKKGHYVISAPGFVSNEAPYTNYLPEFFQKAEYSFYKKDGKYVDGFSEKAMEDALTRLATAVKDGVLDKESVTNSTSDSRNKWKSTDPSVETGVFTYWAGTWMNTLKSYLSSAKLDDRMVELKPIKELGTYVERLSPVWAITKHAENPDGIFKYFIDKMLDGGEVQTLWTYGAKGTHWDTKAESVTLKGKEDKPTEYKEGTFHFLPSPEKPTSLMSKNHIDPILSLAKFDGEDPGAAALIELSKTSGEFFAKNSEVAVPVDVNETYTENIGDINAKRKAIVASVAIGDMTAAEGIADYKKEVGKQVDTVLKSLNK
ncbi:MAG: extracellular solute-binding protein [Eubacteriales bacterium]|nr:extracellular solute-binding protein [Eubacteriales bacterium]